MSKKYVKTKIFEVKQSSLLIKYLIILHVIAIFAASLNAVELVYKIVIISMIGMSLFYYVKKELVFNGFSIAYSMSNGWEIALPDEQFCPIEILASTVITSYLIVLHYKIQNKPKQATLICKDALIEGDHRKLIVELKISGIQKERI